MCTVPQAAAGEPPPPIEGRLWALALARPAAGRGGTALLIVRFAGGRRAGGAAGTAATAAPRGRGRPALLARRCAAAGVPRRGR
jgi:hypothetical protein